MPIHDWARANAGVFDHFSLAWITLLQRAMNNGILPSEFFASIERASENGSADMADSDWGLDADTAPPLTSVHDTLGESVILAKLRCRLVVRHTTVERNIAQLEIVAPGNKIASGAVDHFVKQAAADLESGIQLLLIDLFPPGPFDPGGLHGVLWERMGGIFLQPAEMPFTLAAYASVVDGPVTCHVEPTAFGSPMIDMPLFLSPRRYVNLPLEETYMAAFEGVPKRWKRMVEGAVSRGAVSS